MRSIVTVRGSLIVQPSLVVKLADRRAVLIGWTEDEYGNKEAIVRFLKGARADAFDSIIPAESIAP